jgi:hypothetical protein
LQAAIVVLMAGASASCSNSLRLQEPFFTGSTENQREIIGQDGAQSYADDSTQAMPSVARNDDVSRSDLPPPPTQTYASAAPVSTYDDSAAQPGDGAFEWSAVGGRVVTVGANDNLDTLTARFGVPGEQITVRQSIDEPRAGAPGPRAGHSAPRRHRTRPPAEHRCSKLCGQSPGDQAGAADDGVRRSAFNLYRTVGRDPVRHRAQDRHEADRSGLPERHRHRHRAPGWPDIASQRRGETRRRRRCRSGRHHPWRAA